MDEEIDRELQPYLCGSLLSEIEGCDTLLIVGTSLKAQSVYGLVCELARVVHQSDGVVVYIDQMDLGTARFGRVVDFHLKVELQDCFRVIQRTMDKVRSCGLYANWKLVLIAYHRTCRRQRRIFGLKYALSLKGVSLIPLTLTSEAVRTRYRGSGLRSGTGTRCSRVLPV